MPSARYRVHEIKHDGAFLLDCAARPFRMSDVTLQPGQRKRPGSRFSATAAVVAARTTDRGHHALPPFSLSGAGLPLGSARGATEILTGERGGPDRGSGGLSCGTGTACLPNVQSRKAFPMYRRWTRRF
jgi:hypothetical protein